MCAYGNAGRQSFTHRFSSFLVFLSFLSLISCSHTRNGYKVHCLEFLPPHTYSRAISVCVQSSEFSRCLYLVGTSLNARHMHTFIHILYIHISVYRKYSFYFISSASVNFPSFYTQLQVNATTCDQVFVYPSPMAFANVCASVCMCVCVRVC